MADALDLRRLWARSQQIGIRRAIDLGYPPMSSFAARTARDEFHRMTTPPRPRTETKMSEPTETPDPDVMALVELPGELAELFRKRMEAVFPPPELPPRQDMDRSLEMMRSMHRVRNAAHESMMAYFQHLPGKSNG